MGTNNISALFSGMAIPALFLNFAIFRTALVNRLAAERAAVPVLDCVATPAALDVWAELHKDNPSPVVKVELKALTNGEAPTVSRRYRNDRAKSRTFF